MTKQIVHSSEWNGNRQKRLNISFALLAFLETSASSSLIRRASFVLGISLKSQRLQWESYFFVFFLLANANKERSSPERDCCSAEPFSFFSRSQDSHKRKMCQRIAFCAVSLFAKKKKYLPFCSSTHPLRVALLHILSACCRLRLLQESIVLFQWDEVKRENVERMLV